MVAVIFLDIDGVLNRTRANTHMRLDDDLVDRLRCAAHVALVVCVQCI